MKKTFYFLCFILFATTMQAQQNKKSIPKVNIEKFKPPVATSQSTNKKVTTKAKKDIPKVDITKFKAPAKREPARKKG